MNKGLWVISKSFGWITVSKGNGTQGLQCNLSPLPNEISEAVLFPSYIVFLKAFPFYIVFLKLSRMILHQASWRLPISQSLQFEDSVFNIYISIFPQLLTNEPKVNLNLALGYQYPLDDGWALRQTQVYFLGEKCY